MGEYIVNSGIWRLSCRASEAPPHLCVATEGTSVQHILAEGARGFAGEDRAELLKVERMLRTRSSKRPGPHRKATSRSWRRSCIPGCPGEPSTHCRTLPTISSVATDASLLIGALAMVILTIIADWRAFAPRATMHRWGPPKDCWRACGDPYENLEVDARLRWSHIAERFLAGRPRLGSRNGRDFLRPTPLAISRPMAERHQIRL
jgi:hypothetical protein